MEVIRYSGFTPKIEKINIPSAIWFAKQIKNNGLKKDELTSTHELAARTLFAITPVKRRVRGWSVNCQVCADKVVREQRLAKALKETRQW